MANCKDCKHYPMCGFSKYAKAEKCLDFWDVSDVVKVVRCKDCVHCENEICKNPFGLLLTSRDSFCSYGERKANA